MCGFGFHGRYSHPYRVFHTSHFLFIYCSWPKDQDHSAPHVCVVWMESRSERSREAVHIHGRPKRWQGRKKSPPLTERLRPGEREGEGGCFFLECIFCR